MKFGGDPIVIRRLRPSLHCVKKILPEMARFAQAARQSVE